jgi:hypothetical protein
MRIIGETVAGIVIVFFIIAIIATLGSNTAPEGVHNLGLMNDKLCLLIAECTGLLIAAIALAAGEITYWLSFPHKREEKERREKYDQTRRALMAAQKQAADPQRELESQARLNELMHPTTPVVAKLRKAAVKTDDFDAIVASEISPKPPIASKK